MVSIYLSYSHKDKDFARILTSDLRKAGVKVWVDESEIKIGDAIADKMREGIDSADYLAILISESSNHSSWVKQELALAQFRPNLRVLPLLIGDCELPKELEGKLYGDLRQPLLYHQTLKQVLDAIGSGSDRPGARRSRDDQGQPQGGVSAGAYVGIALGGLAIGIGLLVFYVTKAQDLVAQGTGRQVFYVLLIPWALASAAFLFGAMRSYARFTDRTGGKAFELGGRQRSFSW